jgi:hypothetical protein
MDLVAGGDVELAEDLVQMPLDGAWADEQLRADLQIRAAVAREPRNLSLLGRQVIAGFRTTLADRLTGGGKFAM